MSKSLLISPKIFPNNFDFIRYFLAASVILCHSYVMYYGTVNFLTKEPFLVWSHGQISIGSMAVDFFFIISGFLILKSFESSCTTINYLTKRILRIYPGFITAFTLSILIAGFIGTGLLFDWMNYRQYLTNLHKRNELIHLFTLQNPYQYSFFKTSPEKGLNLSLWTIQFEFACYLLVPLFALAGLFTKGWGLLLVFLCMYLVFTLQLNGYIFPYTDKQHLWFGNPFFLPRFITYFLAGSCCYYYRSSIVRNNLIAALAFFVIVISFCWFKCIDEVLPFAGAYLLFFIAFHPRISLGNFARYGDFSYGVYLYAWPVQQVLVYFFYTSLNPWTLFFYALCITTILAFCSWHLVEKPFLKLKKWKAGKPNPIPVVI
ncbi:MAG: acyltransferase [Ferruginibacter sp.]|uniref:acyltransferase family protein n=1 Tax=Ferruginibacter sp. TaxID=1940288 RepID=UPI002658B667|nr:acyltransferase [Ferruginibacter sp.]MDB5277876.1 acyltransferase [Ferruginibacter sp.]